MELTVGSGVSKIPIVHTITPDTQPFFFSGDEQTRAKLINEMKSNDFNIISDRLQVQQKSMTRIKLESNQNYESRRKTVSLENNEASFIHCNDGSVCVSSHSNVVILHRGDSCLIESTKSNNNVDANSEINIVMSAISNNDVIVSKIEYI